MPTLNWIGKDKIVNHDKEVPFRLMKKVKKFSLGKSENLIVEGDNLEALKALMPFYYGKIKCIYIDPPYNTGSEKWIYNDNVNSSRIKEWIGKAVGPEGEDLTRHDKWLCMMYPRLKLLKELLSEDGVIFVSIDDHEQSNLKILMDEIFGKNNFFATLTWINRSKPKNMGEARFNIQQNTEYIYVYGKIPMTRYPRFILKNLEKKKYPYKDKKGNYYRLELISQRRNLGSLRRDTMLYSLKGINPAEGYRWQLSQERYKKLLKAKRIKIIKNKPYLIYYKRNEDNFSYIPFWSHLIDTKTAEDGKKELSNILGYSHNFETVKPAKLINKILFHCTKKDDIILDSFAGSGTTGHAVLDLNKEDGGNRKFILVEMEPKIAKEVTSERIKRVAKGYSYKKNNGEKVKVEGLGGGFEYVQLGVPLFNENGLINKEVGFNDLAQYVYFTETFTNLDKSKIKGNFIGEYNDLEYYLLFKGIDKNILDRKFLNKIKKNENKKIVYADKCLLDEDILKEHNIIFKQIPYQIKVY